MNLLQSLISIISLQFTPQWMLEGWFLNDICPSDVAFHMQMISQWKRLYFLVGNQPPNHTHERRYTLHTLVHGHHYFLKKERRWFWPQAAGTDDEREGTDRPSDTSKDYFISNGRRTVGAGEEFDRAEWISGHQLHARGPEMCLSGSAQGASGRFCVPGSACLGLCLFFTRTVNHFLKPELENWDDLSLGSMDMTRHQM